MENVQLYKVESLKKEKKQRLVGLDLLKVLSMIFIIIHHVSKHGGFFENSTGFAKVFLSIINALFLPSVNVFVITSAYLIIKKGKTSLKNLFKLYFQIVFYSVLTYFLACLLNYKSFVFVEFIKNFFVISHLLFWFVKAYLIMYIVSPLLLKIVNGLNKKEYIITLFAIGIILLYSSLNKNFIMFQLDNGFNAIWFCVLFIITGYQVRFGFNFKKIWFLLVFLLCTILLFLEIYLSKFSIAYSNVIVLIQTISIFNVLYDVNIKNKFCCEVIKYLATCTLGIYLLHDGAYIQPYLYSNILQTQNFYSTPLALLYFMMFCLIIFAAGVIVESLRKSLLKLIKFTYERIKRKKSEN